jgi:lysozyme family protein
MQKNFKNSLKHVLVHEGGYVDHPQDPGGATNKGVTLAVFQRFYGTSKGKDDLQAITDEQLEHIYKTGYWNKCRCDDLPNGVDYVVFDQAVNTGPGRSAKWLQAVVGATVDGVIGPLTIATTWRHVPTQVINAMCDERLAFKKRIMNGDLWKTFGRGWQARVDGVREHGIRLATGTPASVDQMPDPEDQGIMPSVDYEIVRLGSRGDWVKKLQTVLKIEADGIFDLGTEVALKAYQAEAGLTIDGVAGRKTYQSLGLVGAT